MITVFVPDLPEFMPLVEAARAQGVGDVRGPEAGYWRLDGEGELVFRRRELGLGPALWNSALTGGFRGRILEFSRDIMRIGADV